MEAALLRKHLERLQEFGFGIESFGGDSFLVEALPALLSDQEPATLLLQVLEELEESDKRSGSPRELRERLARSCCRLAAEGAAMPREQDCQQMLDRLSRCEMPYTTPHGRPTLIHLGFKELRRKFGLQK